jgi:prepilin-type N-terminal cleavage/methylation domain-containing protein
MTAIQSVFRLKPRRKSLEPGQRGFTLIELAIVMFIVALILGGMLLPLSAQQDVRARSETTRMMNEAREALIGFAMINDRFPCPASAASNGRASPEGSGACTKPYDGFFPAATLGMVSSANDGYAYDGWGNEAAHRLRYGLSATSSSTFSTTGGMKTIGIGAIAGDLVICNTGTGVTATACAAPANTLTDTAITVIYALGKNAPSGGTSADEAPNVDGNRVFISAPSSPDYDDSVIWLSPTLLVGRLVAAGRLP